MVSESFPQTWDLASLFPAPEAPEFREILDRFAATLRQLADESERLPPLSADVPRWEQFLRGYEQVEAQAADLRACVECYLAADAENKLYRQLEAELSALGPWRERIATNVDYAVKDLAPAEFDRAVAASAYLTRMRYFLWTRRTQAALRLPREQEFLAADLAVDGLEAWGRQYDRLSGALKVQVIEKGRPVVKSPGQVLFDSPQRAVRENNFYAADAAWASIEESCAEALNHIAGTRLTLYKHLGLDDHLTPPCLYNRMSRATLDAMWQAIAAFKSMLLPYLTTKARLLGLPRLSWYDLSAPLPGIPGAARDDDIPYDRACQWILEAFSAFSAELGAFARQALSQRWVEAENRPGKRQGGFCTGFPTPKQSRIFMTYTNSADSMSTLAHELGHAYHTWVLRDEPIFLADYPMTLAETASTFAEAVLAEQRLQRAGSDYERLALLDALLSDAVVYLMNIHARFLFEDRFYRERRRGEIPVARLSELMTAAQQEAYVQALADDGWNPRLWVSKLHFYITGLPFYNFPYTFGYLLSLGVYAVGREAGPGFAEQYRRLLIATGCCDAEDAVQSTLGFDLRRPEFWEKSLQLVGERVSQFTTLAERFRERTRAL
uniref:Oligoendopeptidase F n=1 Tax=Schlesneria paludicola TaxID=360056 RepID=A0A7C4LLR3_9PLAN